MTPTIAELLRGCTVALNTPPPPESAGDFMASRVGLVSMILGLCAQEAERHVAATLAENADIRALFAKAGGYGPAYADAAHQTDANLAITPLDAVNAELRRKLIALHKAVETAKDKALDRAILELYVRMAAGRRLVMGG
jgi:hypothetical protein